MEAMQPETIADHGKASRLQTVAFWASLVLVAALYLGMTNNRFHFLMSASSGDILLAEAIAEGHGFREVWRLGSPPCTVRPPGLAFVLAPFAFPPEINLFAMKLMNNLFGPLGFVGAYLFLLVRTRNRYAALMMALYASTLFFLVGQARFLYSGIAYFALVSWSLYFFERTRQRVFADRWRLTVFSVLSAAAFLVRSIGIAVGFSGAASLALSGRGSRRLRMFWTAFVLAVVMGAAGGWTLRNYLAEGAKDEPYLSKLMVGEPLDSLYWLAEDQGVPIMPEPKPLNTARFVQRIYSNTAYYIDRVAGTLAAPLDLAPYPVRAVVSVLFLVSAVAGAALLLLRERGAAEFYVIFTLAIAVLWPFPHERYLAPALPPLLLCVYQLANSAARRMNGKGRFLVGGLSAVLVAATLANIAYDTADLADRFADVPFSRPHPSGFEVVTERPAAMNSMLLLEWVRENTEEDAVVMFHSINPCGLVARRTCAAVPMAPPGRVMEYIDSNGIDYVVMDDEMGEWGASFFSENFLLSAIDEHPERFGPVGGIKSSPHRLRAKVYRVVPASR